MSPPLGRTAGDQGPPLGRTVGDLGPPLGRTVGDQGPPLGQAGQATVEVAMVLPLLALLLAAVVQAGLVARDQVRVTRAAAAAARAVVVEPGPAAARRAVEESGLDLAGRRTAVEGDLRSGGLAAVSVSARPTRLPLVGWALAGVELSERFVARVE